MRCKRLLSLTLAAAMLFGSASMLPENTLTQQTEITASAVESLKEYNSVDGGTEKNYSSKYKCTILIFGRPECGNTMSTLKQAAKLASNKDINVVFVDIDSNSFETVASFKESMALPGVKFCYDESGSANSDAWYYIKNYHDKTREFKSTLPFVAFLDSNGDVVNASTARLDYSYLALYAVKCGAEVEGADFLGEKISFNVTYQQSDARNMLKLVNSFRTGNDTWVWNEDNTQKVYRFGLGKLQYDYELEKAAMQRAADLVVLYSHTRPNGESFSSAYSDSFNSYVGENIAVGFKSVEDVFAAWREDDKNYDGQGHRRNMLDEDYTAIAIAHVKYNGVDFWVQEFSGKTVDTEYKTPNNSSTKVTVELRDVMTQQDELSLNKTTVEMKESTLQALPVLTRTIKLEKQWLYAPAVSVRPDVQWSVKSGNDIVSINGTKIAALKAGTAVLTAKFKDKTVTAKVTVSHNWSSWNTKKKATCTTNGKQVRTCMACEKTESRTITKTGHKWTRFTTTGFDLNSKTSVGTRKCSNCGKIETQTVKNAVTRYAGENRFRTAAVISQKMYSSANTVIIASGMDYHDALVAVPLAKLYNAPLLLTTGTQVTKQTETELARLKAKKVIIVSTNGAVSNKVKTALKKYNPTVIGGSTYYQTSVKVAQAMTKKTGKYPEALFFVTASSYADALSASPVSAIKNAPIIYINKNTPIDSDVYSYLWDIGWWKGSVEKAYVIGGKSVISDSVMKRIADYLELKAGKTVQRIAGNNRYETCVKVNNYFKGTLSGNAVCITRGYNFPDALAGGVFAAKNKAPLFLADKLDKNAAISKVQSSYLKSKNPSKLYIFGGETAVPTQLVKTISKACV